MIVLRAKPTNLTYGCCSNYSLVVITTKAVKTKNARGDRAFFYSSEVNERNVIVAVLYLEGLLIPF